MIRGTRRATAVMVLVAGWHVLPVAAALAQDSDLREFVRGTYHHGLPVDEARRFGPQAAPVLIEMLQDERERDAWPNIVHMLGLLENPAATKPLVDFLENRFKGPVDNTTYRALVLVPQSLGFLAGGSDREAQSYLVGGLSHDAWQTRRLSWTYPALSSEDRGILMVKLSAAGVGLIGTPESLKVLDEARTRIAATPGRFQQSVLPGVEEAILVNRIIQQDGRNVLFNEQLPRRLEQERQKTQSIP